MQAHRVPSLYLDTSVIGGYFDEKFKDATQELWRQMEKGLFRFFTSPTVLKEIAGAPEWVRDLAAKTFYDPAQLLSVGDEIARLARDYIDQNAVPRNFAEDAVHVAVTVVHRMDFLVSWNYKHLANVHRNDAFNAVNLLQGYPLVRIVNPLELIYGSQEKRV